MLPTRVSKAIKQFPLFYEYLVSIVLSFRRFSYLLATWPAPTGKSTMDSFWARKSFENEVNRLRLGRTRNQTIFTSAILEAAARDDTEFKSLSLSNNRMIPVSFSWPGPQAPMSSMVDQRNIDFSSIYPGKPYSYSDYEDYLANYSSAKYAITFKKGGWDCFRHVEILACGAIPIMPDIKSCPKFAMAHYPKNLLALALSIVRAGEHLPQDLVDAVQQRFNERLTSEKMASFILGRINFASKNVLFLDPNLNHYPDYLSVMTLVGLKLKLGKESIRVPYGASPIYKDWTGNSENFHGLGFGYTSVLSEKFKNKEEGGTLTLSGLAALVNEESLIIASDISRNQELANFVSDFSHPTHQKVYIWGSDRSPNRAERLWLESLRGFIAIREQY
jgi:hypothetical protein